MLGKLLIIYIFAINLGGFALMGWDKYKAKKYKWRVPEQRFFLVAVLGGSVDTRHPRQGHGVDNFLFGHKFMVR